MNKTWNSREYRISGDLDKYYWEQGFFYANFNTKKEYVRNFNEIRLRDQSLFTLGEIKGKTILDMGCGSGLYSLTFLKMGAKSVSGQDIQEVAITRTQERVSECGFNNFTGKVGDCSNLQFDDREFDLVFSGDVFEHISDELKLKFIQCNTPQILDQRFS